MFCKLKKSLYGLKQAPRAWFKKFHTTICASGLRQSSHDHSMFLRETSAAMIILLIYVDDIIITGNDTAGIFDIKAILHSSFHMKDLGALTYFLGLEVTYTSNGLGLNQTKYTCDIIREANLTDDKVAHTPMEVNVKYKNDDGKPISDPTHYRKIVGSLVYLTMTRPDISFAVHILSQFVSDPRQLHLAALHRVIQYLKGSIRRGIFFPSSSMLNVKGFTDADWAGCPDSRRSTTGWCMFLGDSLISWKCKKQDRVSKSSTEAEYRSMSTACSEIVWLQRLLDELRVKLNEPTQLFVDNMSAIQIANNPVFHERTKHIEVDCHYIRELLQQGLITLPHIKTEHQLADIFTKAKTRGRHEFLLDKLMLKSASI
ncbi:uncharacterized mitochondrial protein AtMg00810-like [Dioscorea cayenensis subsp. rotundata]|uniref:Uncharacterized mitochondrial protein AtMg00810-like n=1 Tax=Dioscorea cayennensis subsp. rotundata TaxID=55577 RepID=A0AB40C327_DIOCR|nr:uncharacterized mitochondrial protein AtMg00810-like [Dioscorea cayenensis subsp. rotundata]